MVKLHDTMDAVVWAREFMRLYRKFGYEPDEQTMIGWFANAIMCGYDHYRWQRERLERKYGCSCRQKERKVI